jgi:hypothetical protein
VSYLGDLSGSALGGFHLTAMGALVKLGRPAIAPARSVAEGPDSDAAVNAVGVLGGLSPEFSSAKAALRELASRSDRVGQAAQAVLGSPG